jgi:hypothetical protein
MEIQEHERKWEYRNVKRNGIQECEKNGIQECEKKWDTGM